MAGDACNRLRWMNLRPVSIIIAVLSFAGLMKAVAQDGPWREQTRLLPADTGVIDDEFGEAVAIDGDLAVVGSPEDDDQGVDAGAAYIYRRWFDGVWRQEAKLLASDGLSGDFFGNAADIDGSVAVVGAHGHDALGSGSGAAYVFRRQSDGQWVQEAKLIGSGTNGVDFFGGGVAICKQRIVVGAWGVDTATGAAYVFERDGQGNWQETAILTPVGAIGRAEFGRSVGVDGDLIVVGAPGDESVSADTGAVFVFRRTNAGSWAQEAKITASDAFRNAHFGSSVSIDGGTILAGAPSGGIVNLGSAYIFQRDSDGQWIEEAKIVAPDPVFDDYFGLSVVLKGGTAVIGAPLHKHGSGLTTGAAYVFRRSSDGTWAFEAELIPSDASSLWNVGNGVGIDFDRIIVGMPRGRGQILGSGVAATYEGFDFRLEPPEPGEAGVNNVLRVERAPHGAVVAFGYSLGTGETQVPGCPGVTLYLDQPILIGTVRADSQGRAGLTAFVPGGASGRTVWVQAAVPGQCAMSNPVEQRFR